MIQFGASIIAAAAVGLCLNASGFAGEVFRGPVAALVVRVVDGDTFEARARIWLGQEITVMVRLEGVDTPELRGRCGRETLLASQAKVFAEAHLVASDGAPAEVALEDIRHDKFAGRVIARVRLVNGTDLAAALVGAGLARPYAGSRRSDWCLAGSS